MKTFSIKIYFILALITVLSVGAFAQEYDDIYFRKKDRVKEENVLNDDGEEIADNNQTTTDKDELNKLSNPDYLAYSDSNEDGEEEYFEEGYEPQTSQQAIEGYKDNADVVVKHYYYGYPATTYYSSYDAVFWSDPFLYQGTVFDPFYDPYYRSGAYYRPGWNISVRIGSPYSYYGRNNRWSYGYGSYYGYNSYYGWGGYYDPWYGYYDPYWCPPSYYGGYYNRNVIIVNNEGYYNSYNSRGVVRGRRSTRDSYSGSRTSGSRVADGRGNISSGRVADNSNGRTEGSRSSRASTNSRNYSDFDRSNSSSYSSRNSTRTDVNTRSSRRNGSTNYSNRSSSSNNRTYSNRSSNSSNSSSYNNRSSNSSRSRSSSSYGSSSRSSSSRSNGSYSRSGSSSRSSSSGTSRSSSGSSSGRKKN